MISILVEAMEIHLPNMIINDLLESFGQVSIEDSMNIKIKKNRRKHFKELTRLKKLGVLGCKTHSSCESRNKNHRKMSENRIDNVIFINPNSEVKQNGKRNSYNNFKESKSHSSNALLPKNHQSKLSVSVEKSSGNKDSQIDHSNGDQGTRMDSPLLNSSHKDHPKEQIKPEDSTPPNQLVCKNTEILNLQNTDGQSKPKKRGSKRLLSKDTDKEKLVKKKQNDNKDKNFRISISRTGTRNRIKRNERALVDSKDIQADNIQQYKDETYFLNVNTNDEYEKAEDDQANQVGSRSPAADESEPQVKIENRKTEIFKNRTNSCDDALIKASKTFQNKRMSQMNPEKKTLCHDCTVKLAESKSQNKLNLKTIPK